MAHHHRAVTRRQFVQATGAGSLAIAGVGFGHPIRAQAAKPNIVFILMDNLGYGELGIQGNPQIPTPNIDSLAKNGVRFTSGYVSGPYCSPTRAGLLTGRCCPETSE